MYKELAVRVLHKSLCWGEGHTDHIEMLMLRDMLNLKATVLWDSSAVCYMYMYMAK